MGTDKVIVKAFLSSLAAIGVLLLFIVGALCAVFPSTMMELSYNLGMENSCIHFAERVYKDSDEIYFIAYATEVAIEEDKSGKLISCGEAFIADEEFEEYCLLKGDGYKEFVCGKICVAKYEKGDKEDAVSLAYETLNGSFTEGNAMVALLFTANGLGDEETVLSIKTKINELNLDSAQKAYLDGIYAIIDR